MLTKIQNEYLNSLSKERSEESIFVHPYDPRTDIVAEKIIRQIKQLIPEADIKYIGGSALKISGQNDVDLYIICPSEVKEDYFSRLFVKFGDQKRNKWQWHDDYDIKTTVYLSDPNDRKFTEQLDFFDVCKIKPEVAKEYEAVKESVSGKSYREYQIAKYEFYNRVLGIT